MDDRDQVIYDCPHALDAGRGYGDMSLRCTDCALARGTVYADGYEAGCVHLPAEKE